MNTLRNVSDLAETERQSLEQLVGQPLVSDQEVFVMVYKPGAVPDEKSRAEARQRLMQGLDELQADLQRRGVTEQDVDAAIEEAMNAIRRPAT